MKRMIVFLAFSGLVFAVGLAAGRQVTQVTSAEHSTPSAVDTCHDAMGSPSLQSTLEPLTHAPFDSSDGEPQESPKATNLTSADSTEASFIRSASLAGHVSGINSVSHLSSDIGESTVRNDVTHAGASRDDLIALIHRMMPNADEETIAVWADSYAGMELADVEFILEQKRRLDPNANAKTGLGSSSTLNPTPNATTNTPMMKAVEQNLNAAMAIGYRRLVVLPEPCAANGGSVTGGSVTSEYVSFRSFDAGRVIASPVASHGSLSTESPSHMFLLENNVVTRRGDFQRLSDGTIGLRVAGQEYRIHNTPSGIEDTSRLELTTTGEFVAAPMAGEKKAAGRLCVVAVPDPSTLTTSDGVIFTCPTTPEPVPESSLVIRPGSLELSNVNITEESLLKATLTGS